MAAEIALGAAKHVFEDAAGDKKKFIKPRIIPIPKSGGILPLLPIFAGLSALGSVAGGAAGLVKTINDVRVAKKQLQETMRHNKAMEQQQIPSKQIGDGLYLKPYKQGFGLYLKPYNTKN